MSIMKLNYIKENGHSDTEFKVAHNIWTVNQNLSLISININFIWSPLLSSNLSDRQIVAPQQIPSNKLHQFIKCKHLGSN